MYSSFMGRLPEVHLGVFFPLRLICRTPRFFIKAPKKNEAARQGQGSLNYTCWGDQTMQIYEDFDGFPPCSALFRVVLEWPMFSVICTLWPLGHLTIEDLQKTNLFYWIKNETTQHFLACFVLLPCHLKRENHPLRWFSWTKIWTLAFFFKKCRTGLRENFHILFGTVFHRFGESDFTYHDLSAFACLRVVSRNVRYFEKTQVLEFEESGRFAKIWFRNSTSVGESF